MVDARKGITFEFTQAWALHVIKSYSKIRLKGFQLDKNVKQSRNGYNLLLYFAFKRIHILMLYKYS